MPVYAITPDYKGEVKDRKENFGDNQVVYVGWDHHLMFPAPFAFLLPMDMPFKAMIEEVLPVSFSVHPEWEKIDWSTVEWMLDGKVFKPDFDKSLGEQGVGHKSIMRFNTPELKGFQGAGV